MLVKAWTSHRRGALRRQEGAARAAGKGVYVQEWAASDGAPRDRGAVVGDLIEWCRQTISGTRRPFGIDRFDLALAIDTAGGGPRSTRFKMVRPIELYVEDGLDLRLSSWLAGFEGSPVNVAAALFSWGDAADARLPARV